MLHFYIGVIRPVLEYAVAIWHTGLTADLSDNLKQYKSEHFVSYLAVQVSPINRMNIFVLTWKFYSARRDQLDTRFS